MIVFKVVKRYRNGVSVSAMAPVAPSVKYDVNKETIPKEDCGPLCAFVSLDCALKWAENFTETHILKVFIAKATPSKQKRIWGRYPDRGFLIEQLPRGTVLCDSITPISEMKVL